MPGGAPANVAFHAQQLGLNSAVATRVGQDAFAAELMEFLRSKGLSTRLVQADPNHQTGTVMVSPLANGGTNYAFLENSAWDYLEPEVSLLDEIHSAKAICFGTLAQRRPLTRATIHRCLNSAPKPCLIVYDVNLRPPFFAKDWIAKSLGRAKVVKLNDDEVKQLSKMFEFESTDEIRFAKRLLDTYRQLDLVCITRGGHGCLGVSCDEVVELPGIPVQVVDTVGAGDAFTAAVIFGRLNEWPLASTLNLANHFGSLVASRAGAMPDLSTELRLLLGDLDWTYRETPLLGGNG